MQLDMLFVCVQAALYGALMGVCSLKDRMKQARRAAGLTQAQLAKDASVSQQLISQLETGRAEGSTEIPTIAAILGVLPLWLAKGEGGVSDGAVAAPPAPVVYTLSNCTEADRRFEPLIDDDNLTNAINPLDRMCPGDVLTVIPAASGFPKTNLAVVRKRGADTASIRRVRHDSDGMFFVDPINQLPMLVERMAQLYGKPPEWLAWGER